MKCATIIFVAVLVAFASAQSEGINAQDGVVSFDDKPMRNTNPKGSPALGGPWKMDSAPPGAPPGVPQGLPQIQSNRNQKRVKDTFGDHRKRGDKMGKKDDSQFLQSDIKPM